MGGNELLQILKGNVELKDGQQDVHFSRGRVRTVAAVTTTATAVIRVAIHDGKAVPQRVQSAAVLMKYLSTIEKTTTKIK